MLEPNQVGKALLDYLLPGGGLTVALGFGFRQAHLKGQNDEQMKEIVKSLDSAHEKLRCHEEKLAESETNFKVIDTKLDNVSSTLVELKEGQKEIRDLVMKQVGAKG